MSTRLAYNIDGTICYRGDAFASTQYIIDPYWVNNFNGDITWGGNADFGADQFAFNFPAVTTIRSFAYRGTEDRVFTAYVSSNSINGYDGTWTLVGDSYSYFSSGRTLTTYNITTPTPCTWFKFVGNTQIRYAVNIFLFGDYAQPNYSLCNTNGVVFTEEYPLSLTQAANNAPYSNFAEFKIKNNHNASHTYKVYVLPVRAAGDSFISNYFTIGHDVGGVWTKVDGDLGYTTASVTANGGFSEILRVYADFSIAQNTADGYHYFVVKVVEN